MTPPEISEFGWDMFLYGVIFGLMLQLLIFLLMVRSPRPRNIVVELHGPSGLIVGNGRLDEPIPDFLPDPEYFGEFPPFPPPDGDSDGQYGDSR